MRRRDFLKLTAGAVGATALPRIVTQTHAAGSGSARPNILWISAEDISPDLRCYGDQYAVTPNLDAFAAQGTRFDACFAHMGVCAPARSGIITGRYPTSMGTNHMRCRGVPQHEVKCFTEYLRAAGYYCTNRSKTDYQFSSPLTAWDGGRRDWRGRAKGQPFFSVINLGTTHEGQIRNKKRRTQIEATLTPEERHDPAKAELPPYYPDTPVVRQDWAQYYDLITLMDKEVARILGELEADGLADNTIVWFWGDHGRGLPRGKRWIYDSGLHAPLLIRVPEKFRELAGSGSPDSLRPGTASGELVSFVDFAPTMLSLAGVKIPDHIQGQAFLGPQKAKPRMYVYGARDRVDEAYDMIRCVRDKRYKYIRNFMPHLPRSLDVSYMNRMPTMQEMRRLHTEGKLEGPQMQYFGPTKPVEELYDTQADPHEVRDLATDPKHEATLTRMRKELFAWMRQTGDLGLLPECEFDAIKRPNDQYELTTAPGVAVEPRGDASAVSLACATPGASMAYRVEGTKGAPAASGIFLKGTSAKFLGRKPWPRKSKTYILGWRNSQAWLSWDVEIKQAGRIPVHVCWACAGKERSQYVLSIAGQELAGQSDCTGGWEAFVTRKLGEVDIPEPGKYTVTLKPIEKPGVFQMNLMHVVLDGKNVENYQPSASPWQLYSRPIALSPGQRLTAKACRLGFRDSKAVHYDQGSAAIPAEPASVRPHWREVVNKSGVIDRLLALKSLDGAGEEACAAYLKAFGDAGELSGSVRYWAVLGLHTHGGKAHIGAVRRLLNDPSPAVRVAAAQALCDWGEAEGALPAIVEVLKTHPTGTARLLAATALNQLGEKARPALPAIQAARKDRLGYVRRMCEHALACLGGK